MAKVSIIIRCYNEEAHIGRLLSGIMQQSINDFEIIIVDSGSTDATLSIASQYPAKILKINKEDFSFGNSLNFGCEAASGEFLVFVSAHVYPVYDDWITQLLQPFENDNVACVYGRQHGNHATKFSEHQVFAQWFPETSDLNQNHPFCNNANAAVRRSVWERIRYDETLTGLEDLAWAKQVISAGFRIGYKSDAEVVHVHEETPGQVLNRYRREAIAMKAIFPHEKFSFLQFLHMWTKNVFYDAGLALKRGVFLKNIISIMSFRLMQFWGTYRGYAQVGLISRSLRRKFYYPNDISTIENPLRPPETNRTAIDYSSDSREFDCE
jgi:rhamnosyltransferase